MNYVYNLSNSVIKYPWLDIVLINLAFFAHVT